MYGILRFLICVVVIAYLSSCDHEYPKSLVAADSLANVRPESASRLLDSLEKPMSSASEADRMYFRLLRVKTADKLCIKHSSDREILDIVRYYENDGDKALLPLAYCYAGRVYYDMDSLSRSFDYYNLCLKSSEIDRDIDIVSLVCSHMGLILRKCKLPKIGINAYKCAYRCDVMRGNVQDQMFDLRDIGRCHYDEYEYDSAFHYYSKAEKLASIYKDTMMLACTRVKLAVTDIVFQKYNEAEKYLAFVDSVGDSLSTGNLLESYSKLYVRTGRMDEAFKCYEKLLDGDIICRSVAHQGLYRYYTYKGDNRKADYHLVISDSISRKIMKLTPTEEISRKEFAYETLFTKHKRINSLVLVLGVSFFFALCVVIFYVISRIYSRAESPNATDEVPRVVDDSALLNSPIYKRLKLMDNNDNSLIKLTKEEWAELDKIINQTYIGFKKEIFQRYDISSTEYRICLLVKINMPIKIIGLLTNMSSSSVTNVRTRLYKKLFGVDGTARDTDKFIRSL